MSKEYRSKRSRDRGDEQGDGLETTGGTHPQKGDGKVRVALCFIASCAFFAGTGLAATIQVPEDQPTIQGAIDASVNGDLVLVGDANPKAPRLLRFRVDDGAFTPDGEISAHPDSGLPPRHLAFY